jgi:XRE family transcriptional regulator, aerobic/anaerobic benzoate catabolism transcriptional regulator
VSIMDDEHPDVTDDIPDSENREFLMELGQRVRNMRAMRGMSRKMLAQVSGISERYLAQLESGAGNLSIMLLRRVAQATNSPVEDLVTDTPLLPEWSVIRELLRRASPGTVHKVKEILSSDGLFLPPIPAAVMVNRIALIGMRGAGKTTLGRAAAERLGWPFFELDKEIEALANLPLEEIFRLYGQEGYRRFEEKALKAIIERTGPIMVAASGGIVAEPLAFDLLLTSFLTIWVRAAPEEHMNRLREHDAPLIGRGQDATEELATVLASREPFYRRARAVLDTSGVDTATSVAELVDMIQHYCERNCPWALRYS